MPGRKNGYYNWLPLIPGRTASILIILGLALCITSSCMPKKTDEIIIETPYLRYIHSELIDYSALHTDKTDYSPAGKGSYPGQTYYVSTTGSNKNDGLSLAAPFSSIQHALEQSQDGDTVWIRGGTYITGDLVSEHIPNRQLHSNFVLAAWPNEKVIIQSDLPGVWEHRNALSLTGPIHDLVIDGLEFRDFTGTGISFGNPNLNEEPQRRILLKNLIIRDANEAIVTHYSSDGDASKVYIDGLLIKNVLLLNIKNIGINAGQSARGNLGIYRNIHIDCTKIHLISGGTGSGADCLAFENGFNILIENSLVEGASADGIDIKGQNVAILNCIARHIGRNGIKCWQNSEIVNVLSFDTGADANLVLDGNGTILVRDSVFAFHNARSNSRSYSFTIAYDTADSFNGSIEFSRCVFFSNTDWGFIPSGGILKFNSNIFWQIPTKRLFVHHNSSPGDYYYSDLNNLNNQTWASDNQISDPGFRNPSYKTDNLIREKIDGEGFKDILIDQYFQELLKNI